MKTSLTFTMGVDATASASASTRSDRVAGSLGSIGVGETVCVRAMRLETAEADWLRAIGLFEGQRVTLLRRALFRGPLHVRTASGGEFAVDRALAEHIDVEPATREPG